MSKHTPGPWRDRCPMIYGAKRVGHSAVARVSEQFMNRTEREANARLIAAAPEMLEALRAVAKTDGVRDLKVGGVSIQALIDAAIAKAEGRGE